MHRTPQKIELRTPAQIWRKPRSLTLVALASLATQAGLKLAAPRGRLVLIPR